MLDLGTNAGLAPIGSLVRLSEGTVLVGAPVGEVFRLRRNLLEPLPLSFPPVGAVTIEAGFPRSIWIRFERRFPLPS